MEQIIIDATMRDKLPSLTLPLEVRDESGQLLGIYTPRSLLRGPQVSDEELRRRAEEESEEYSTAEVLEYLERL